ncbi:MAG: tripartite tricarboxylate transporter substrate-binding protein [Eubacteriales bacterium]|nr:tripartite tricarboxylate transporter substrate-binding protein [Eubacteriales bacterium]MDD3571403.1 tripartite tricarboxylate transporter substrate-binding protein [Eubacteriales bacterium]MDD4135043.1 tripartite tricarboxylate transporter substrate-binding protein [Eubacteriales bacterium]
MKKLVSILVAALLLAGVFSIASAEWTFERKVDIVCPWGVGGGADSTIRPMANLLKDIIGQQVDVLNVEGGGGVNGVEFTYKQPADGYTFMLGTQSLIMQDLQGNLSMEYKTEFIPVAKLVHSINIIAGSKKAMEAKGYNNFSSMIEYVKEHPFEVSVGMLTATGADGASLKQALAGLDVLEVSYASGAEMNAALMGGHIDMMITGTDEIQGLIESGDVVPLVACAENRMKLYPDMECTGELGIDSYIGTWRGLFAKKGTPQEAIDAMVAAVAQAVETQTWQDFLVAGAYDERPGFETGDDFMNLWNSEYEIFTDYLREEGVLAKEY